MNKITRSRQWGLRLAGPAPLLVILLTACKLPLPITPVVVATAEDSIPPIITITSPANNTAFFSTTRITGKISDHALKNGDNLGSLSSLSVVAGANSAQKGKILIDPAGNVRAVGATDPSGGDAKITYNANTGDFSIEMDTKNLNRDINVRITALDLNGNSGVSILNLLEGDGPLVEFSSSVPTALTKLEIIGVINLEGTIFNNKEGVKSTDENKIDEIEKVVFKVQSIVTHEMNLNKIKPNNGVYKSTIKELQGESLENPDAEFYLNENGTFKCNFQVLESSQFDVERGGLIIEIIAFDKNKRSGSVKRTIGLTAAGPIFKLIQPARSQNYYSSNTNQVYSSLTRSSAAIGVKASIQPRGAGIVKVTVKEDSSSTPKVPQQVLWNNPLGKNSEVKLEPGANDVALSGRSLAGTLRLRFIATDKQGDTTTITRIFKDDTTAPTFKNLRLVKPGTETPVEYAKGGDKVVIKSDGISDTGAGVHFDSLNITGTPNNTNPKSQLINNSKQGNPFSQEITIPTSRSSSGYPDVGPVTFTMSVKDNVENTQTQPLPSFKYYHTLPSSQPPVRVDKIPPSSASGPNFLKPNDTIRASFTSTRDIDTDNTKIYFNFNGRDTTPLTVSKAPTTNTYQSADYIINSSDPEGLVGWKLKYFDKAGNTANYPLNTSGIASTTFTMDKTSPTVDPSSLSVQSVPSPSRTDTSRVGLNDKAKVTFTASDNTGGSGIDVSSSINVEFKLPGGTLVPSTVSHISGSTYEAVTDNAVSALAATLAQQGTMDVDVTVSDRAGNSAPTVSSSITVDTMVPTIGGPLSVESIPSPSRVDTSTVGLNDKAKVTFTASDAGGSGMNTPTVVFKLPDTTLVPSTVSHISGSTYEAVTNNAVSALAATSARQGDMTVDVKVSDGAGNDASQRGKITVDTFAPSTPTLLSIPSTSTNVGDGDRAEVTFTASDTGSGVSTSLTEVVFTVGGTALPGTVTRVGTSNNYRAVSRQLNSSDPQGRMTATVKVFDIAGNSHAATPASVPGFITVDTLPPPTPTLLSIPSTSTNVGDGDQAEVTFTATDSGSGISTSLTEVVFTVGGITLSGTVTRLGTSDNYRAVSRQLNSSDPQGRMTATVKVFDIAGNSHAATPASVPGFITVDTLPPPTPTLLSIPSTSTNVGDGDQAEVTFTATDSGSGISTSLTEVVFTFTVGGTTLPGTVTRVGTSNNYRAVSRQLNSSDPQGRMTATVKVFDSAGNSHAATPASVPGFITVDTLPPPAPTALVIRSTSTTDNTKVGNNDQAEVTFTATDSGSGISTSLTEVVFTVGSTTLSGTVTRLGTSDNYRAVSRQLNSSDPQGAMTATVKVFDSAGNRHAATPASVPGSITVDTVAPDFSTASPPTISSYNAARSVTSTTSAGIGSTITVGFTLSEAQGSGSPTVRLEVPTSVGTTSPINIPSTDVNLTAGSTTQWQATYTVSAPGGSVPTYSGGAVTLNVTATDAAGNTGSLSHLFVIGTVNFTIDNDRPTFTGGPTLTPAQPTAGYSLATTSTIGIQVTGVSADATGVEFDFFGSSGSPITATQGTSPNTTWSANVPSMSLPAAGTYTLRVKVTDGHGNVYYPASGSGTVAITFVP